jgi:hypothetical protein
MYPAPRPLQTFYWDLYKHQMSSRLKTQDKPGCASRGCPAGNGPYGNCAKGIVTEAGSGAGVSDRMGMVLLSYRRHRFPPV